MKDSYQVVGTVLKTMQDSLESGMEAPIKVSMHSKLKEIYDSEIVDFVNENDVMFCISQCEIVVDNSLPDDMVFSGVTVH